MRTRADYMYFRDGSWRVWLQAASAHRSSWPSLRRAIETQTVEKAPQLNRLAIRREGESVQLLLKIYPPGRRIEQLKDFFRVSKAVRYWLQALALSSCGFLTPPVWAFGEQRVWGRLTKAFIATELVPAQSLSTYLWENPAAGSPWLSAREKWACIRELGRQVGRMHKLGFVHGDLVLSNVLVRYEQGRPLYYYIDHDRTRRYPSWFPQTLWKRNLVQLNRLVFPGISTRDRLRFFHAYLEENGRQVGARERRLLRWLGRRTIARRKETRRSGRELRRPRPRQYAELRIENGDQ